MHVGDVRATDMAAAGMVELGQLARERHPGEVVAVGFGGCQGSLIAAGSWGAQMQRMPVPPSRPGSVEALLHERLRADTLFVLPDDAPPAWLTRPLDHRAIGVVRPYAVSRASCWNHGVLPQAP